MRVEPLGDAAFVLRDLPAPAYLVAEGLLGSGLPGLLDAAASYETVGVFFEPGRLTAREVEAAVEGFRGSDGGNSRSHVVPVCYEMGEDLRHVALELGLSEQAVVEAHSGPAYQCFAVGFCPGFPYLGWLPEALQGIPRLASPRPCVEPGSVGLTGRQTGVYPLPKPGGWRLIGRTPLTLVDVAASYFPIRAGDLLRFEPITAGEYERLKGERL